MEKKCSQCGEMKTLAEFNKSGGKLRSECRVCTKRSTKDYYQRNKDNKKIRDRAYRSRMSQVPRFIEQNRIRSQRHAGKARRSNQPSYQEILVSQNGKCAICGKAEIGMNNKGTETRALAVDHDHETGVIRGLLCSFCNTGLGLFQDNPNLLREAASYLEKHKIVLKTS